MSDNVPKLEILFNFIRSSIRNYTSIHADFDLVAFWNLIKDILPKNVRAEKKWIELSHDIINSTMDLPEYYINGWGKKGTILDNQALIEQVRIPLTREANLCNIIQLAIFIGYSMRSKQHKMPIQPNEKLCNYIHKSDIITISESITDIKLTEIVNKVTKYKPSNMDYKKYSIG